MTSAGESLLTLMFGVCLWSRFSRGITAAAAGRSDDFDDYRFDGGICEYYQLVEPGNRSYYLYSPGYPEPFRADSQDRECRWFAKTPSPSDRLVLDCHEFDLPEVPRYICSVNAFGRAYYYTRR